MVHQSFATLKSLIAKLKPQFRFFYAGIFLLAAGISIATISFLVNQRGGLEAIKSEREFKAVSLDALATSWAESFSGAKSLVIFDLASQSTLAKVSSNQVFPIDSLSDFFLSYETALRLSSNFYESTAEIQSGITYLDCLKSLLANNQASCRNELLSAITPAALTAALPARYNLRASTLTSSTASDLSTLFRLFYQPSNFSSAVAGTIDLGLKPAGNGALAANLSKDSALYARLDRGSSSQSNFSHLIATLGLSSKRKVLIVALTDSATPANFSTLINGIIDKLK